MIILEILLIYIIYTMFSIFIFGIVDIFINIDKYYNSLIKPFLLGFIYYIPKTIIIKIKDKKIQKNKEIKREFENEIDEIKQTLKVLDIIMLRIFYDILVGVNCGEYTDLKEKEDRLKTQCLNIMFRINKEENIEDFKEEINITLKETKEGLNDIKSEVKQRNETANRINNKITKEKLNEDMKELKQMIKDNKEYIKYGKGDM